MKTKIKLALLICFLTLSAIVSCSNNNSDMSNIELANDRSYLSKEAVYSSEESLMIPAEEAASDTKLTFERLIIRNADLRMQVLNIQEFRKSIGSLVDGKNIYITNESEFRSDLEHNLNMTIKCKANLFDNFISEIEKLSHYLNHKTIGTEDVTMEFIDLDSRLKTKTSLITRYHEILKQAKNVAEIMQVEKQINDLRTEIESIEARLKYIKNNVSFSTLNLSIYEKLPYSYQADSFGQRVSKAFSVGWKGFVNFLVGIVYLWALWILIALSIVSLRYYIKKKKEYKHKQKHK